MMATLVIGPFYLGIALGLGTAKVGLVMSIGPVIAMFCGIPAGRLVDGFGSRRVILIGLLLLMAGAFSLAALPVRFGRDVSREVASSKGFGNTQTPEKKEVD